LIPQLMAEIEEVRQREWALTVDYPQPNRATLAVALPTFSDQPPMALTVGARKPIMLAKMEAFLSALRSACAELERTSSAPFQS
jgi:DNA-binding IclR family transcriptional regulator